MGHTNAPTQKNQKALTKYIATVKGISERAAEATT